MSKFCFFFSLQNLSSELSNCESAAGSSVEALVGELNGLVASLDTLAKEIELAEEQESISAFATIMREFHR